MNKDKKVLGNLHLQLKTDEAIRLGEDTFVFLNPSKSKGKNAPPLKPKNTYLVVVAPTDIKITRMKLSDIGKIGD